MCNLGTRPTTYTVLHTWEWPQKLWSRVHVNYAGLFLSKMFFAVSGLSFQWIEVHIANVSTAAVSIEKLWLTFLSLGPSEVFGTDSGPLFSSSEFTDYVN